MRPGLLTGRWLSLLIFASWSPPVAHRLPPWLVLRPAPIGLTRAEVERVDPERKELVVSGADIVDGTPILDVKPLVPWRDEGAAQIPEWAAWHGEEDTLCIGCHLSEGCEEALKSAWQQTSHGKVLESEGRFVRLVKEMLALDIRSYRSVPFIAVVFLVLKECAGTSTTNGGEKSKETLALISAGIGGATEGAA